MSWIKTISFENASGKLKQLYRRVAGPNGKIDHILMSHSLRPHRRRERPPRCHPAPYRSPRT